MYMVKKMEATDKDLVDLGLLGENVVKLDKTSENVKFSSLKMDTTSFFHNVIINNLII